MCSKARSCITINHNITARLKVCPYRSNTLGKKLYIHMMVTGHNTSATTCTAQLPCLQCLKCCFSLPGSPQNLPQRSFFTPRVVFALPFQIISSTMQRLQSLANINLSCQICQSFCLSSLLKNMAEENTFWPRTIKDRTSTPADPGKKQCKPCRLRWQRCCGHFSRLGTTSTKKKLF